MKKWTFRFFSPGEAVEDDGQTFGLTASEYYPLGNKKKILGEVFAGTYDEVLERLGQYAGAQGAGVSNAVILFRENEGNEAFIQKFSGLFPGIGCAGGTAAHTDTHGPRVLPGDGDVAVMLVGQPSVVQSCNVHEKIGYADIECEQRYVGKIDGMRADEWFREKAQIYTDGKICYEQLTLSEDNGKNVHFTEKDGRLFANAALDTEKIQIRYVSRKDAQKTADRFANTDDTIVFGCAGVNTLLDRRVPLGEDGMIGFLFSEVVTLDRKPMFANLMLSKIVFRDENS